MTAPQATITDVPAPLPPAGDLADFQPSQAIILLALALFLLYAFRLRTVLRDRMIYLALAVAGVVLAVQPDWSTWLANRIGIGRGTDLLLYVFILLSLFHAVHLVARLNTTERQLTAIVRHIARNHGGDVTVTSREGVGSTFTLRLPRRGAS